MTTLVNHCGDVSQSLGHWGDGEHLGASGVLKCCVVATMDRWAMAAVSKTRVEEWGLG